MLPQYTTEELIANIKRRCSVPTSQLTYTLEDFTLLATDELQGELVPLMMSTREEYFLEYEDISVPADRVIPIPQNTTASKVRTVAYKMPGSPLVLINLPRIDLDVVAGYGFVNYNTLAGFFVQGNDLILYPDTSVPVGTIIRVYFYRRTLNLATPSTYGRVTAVDPLTNEITLDLIPLDWEVGTALNSVSSEAPFRTTNASMTISAIASPVITVDSAEDVEVGDYVSLQGYSAIPQVPIETHAYLAQITAAKALEGLGDMEGMQVAINKAKMLEKGLMVLLSQRVDGSVKKVVSPSGGMRVATSLGRWGRGGTGGNW